MAGNSTMTFASCGPVCARCKGAIKDRDQVAITGTGPVLTIRHWHCAYTAFPNTGMGKNSTTTTCGPACAGCAEEESRMRIVLNGVLAQRDGALAVLRTLWHYRCGIVQSIPDEIAARVEAVIRVGDGAGEPAKEPD